MAVAINKTVNTGMISLQTNATTVVVTGTAAAVTTNLAALVTIHFGRTSNTALTTACFFRIEGSAKASGDGYWFPLAQFSSLIAAVTSQPVNGTCNSGQKVVAMSTTTGMSVGDIVFIQNGTIANSEWGRVTVVTASTSITLEDNLLNAQTGSTVYPSGEMYAAMLDLTAVTRLRVVAGGQAAVTVAFEAFMNTGDSIG